MTHDWSELRAAAADRGGSLEELVGALDLVWVVTAKLGVDLHEDAGRLVGQCPFHDDSDPSFAIFWVGDGKARWGCWSCPDPRGGAGVHGDVLDLIARFKGTGTVASIGYARIYLREYENEGRPQVYVPEVEEGERSLSLATLSWYQNGISDPLLVTFSLQRLAQTRGWHWLEDEVRRNRVVNAFHLHVCGGALVAPYFEDGKIVAMKHRPVNGGTWRAVTGSRLRTWYPMPINAAHGLPIVLCEGESDTWTASEAGYVARGLPAGVGSARSISLEGLRGAGRVIVALDGDEAGRGASRALAGRLVGVGILGAEILDLPDGQDLASLGPDWLRGRIG